MPDNGDVILTDSIYLNNINNKTTGNIANGEILSVALSKLYTSIDEINKSFDTNHIIMSNYNSIEPGDPDDGDTLSVIISKICRVLGEIKISSSFNKETQDNLNKTFITQTILSTKLDNYVSKVEGKDLSSNDFSDEYKEKLESILLDSNHITLTNINSTESGLIDDGDNLSIAISILMHDIGAVTVREDALSTKVDNIANLYVKKVDGKDLSSNDFTKEYIDKINSMQETLDTKNLDSNHVSLVNITYTGETDKIIEGDLLSVAISKLIYYHNTLEQLVKTEYLNTTQLEAQYYKKVDGMGLSSNDFTNDYKTRVDDLTTNIANNIYVYSKEYMDSNFVKAVPGKGLSTNDFNNDYKSKIDNLNKTYLSLSGGIMTGDISSNTHNISLTTGSLLFSDSSNNTIGYLNKDLYTGTSEKTNQLGNLYTVKRNTNYTKGYMAFTSGLSSGNYLYCTQAGRTANTEPIWNDTPGNSTTDGTLIWVTRILGMAYDDNGSEMVGKYLPLTGGTMNGIIDTANNDLKIGYNNKLVFYNGASIIGNINASQYSGNSASASKLTPGSKINGVTYTGDKDITIDCIPSSQKGAVNGVASLDSTGRVPASQLPSYVDSIIEVPTYANLPNPGKPGVMYVTTDTGEIYRWGGTSYTNVSPNSSAAESAMKLTNARAINLTGSVLGSITFDGSKDVSISSSLNNTGVVAGTYGTNHSTNTITVNSEGRITSIGADTEIVADFTKLSNRPTTLAGYGITDSVSMNDVKDIVKGSYLPLTGGDMTGDINMVDAGNLETTTSSIKGRIYGMALTWKENGLYCMDTANNFTVWQYETETKTLTLGASSNIALGYSSHEFDTFVSTGFRTSMLGDSTNTQSTFRLMSTTDAGGTWGTNGATFAFSSNELLGVLQINPATKSVSVAGGATQDIKWNDKVALASADNNFTGTNTFNGTTNIKSLQIDGVSADDKYFSKTDLLSIVNALLPIGFIIESQNKDFNPNTQYPGTTWVQMTAGRVLVSQGAAPTGSSYPVTQTGGVESVTLSQAQIPTKGTSIPSGAICLLKKGATIPDGWEDENPGNEMGMSYSGWIHITPKADQSSNDGNVSAHDNMMPYEVAYRWQRTK